MKTKLHYLICVFALTSYWAEAKLDETKSDKLPNFNINAFEGIIDGLVLVDADTNEDIYQLREGLEIDINEIKDRKLNIRLKPIPGAFTGTIERVDFRLDGPVNKTHSEFVIPYAVFGDNNGDYNGKIFSKGNYSIWVGVDDDVSDSHYWDIMTINFSVGEVVHKIDAFHLVRSDLDLISWEVEDGLPINFVNNPLSFEARPGTFKVGSVVLELSGPISYSATENVEPFTLFGDSNGKFNGKVLPEGDYTLTATPYSETHEKGKKGIPLTIHFSIEFDKDSFSLSSFISMKDAASEDNLETIFVFDKKTIDKKDINTNNVTFVGFPNTSAIKSVFMALQGPTDSFEKFVTPSHTQIENIAPHAMFGDVGGVFNGKALGVGMYRITATPYAGENATGNAGFGRRFEFEIVDSTTFLKKPLQADNNTIALYPNPSGGKATIKASDSKIIDRTLVFDVFGKKVREYSNQFASEQAMDLTGLPKGLYIVQINKGKKQVTKKLVVQ